MKKALKPIGIISFFVIITLSICIGYASLSSNLSVSGSASAEPSNYEGVYIKNVEIVGTANTTYSKNEYILPLTHDIIVTPKASGVSMTYKITVHNNSSVNQWYLGWEKLDDVGQNALIGGVNGISITTRDHASDSGATFNTDDWIPPDTERDFYVTYTYGQAAQTTCATKLKFRFDVKIDAVHDEFLAVLNSIKVSDSYEYLSNIFNEVYAESGKVSISSESHPEVFEALFGDLHVTIDGEVKEASVVIRRENVDKKSSGDSYSGGGPTGCEYSLYITLDGLTPGSTETVYAVAYSQGSLGDEWYQVGDLYEGTAQVNANGELDYSTWKATEKTYVVADGIEYKVAQKNGDQYDLLKTFEDLISTNDQDIFNDIDNRNIFKKVYDILKKYPTSQDPAVVNLRQAFEDASPFYNNFNNGQEFKVVRNKYTRAEIIPPLEKIQAALNYFYQAYPDA